MEIFLTLPSFSRLVENLPTLYVFVRLVEMCSTLSIFRLVEKSFDFVRFATC